MRFRSGIDHWHLPEESFREKRLVFADAERPKSGLTPETASQVPKNALENIFFTKDDSVPPIDPETALTSSVDSVNFVASYPESGSEINPINADELTRVLDDIGSANLTEAQISSALRLVRYLGVQKGYIDEVTKVQEIFKKKGLDKNSDVKTMLIAFNWARCKYNLDSKGFLSGDAEADYRLILIAYRDGFEAAQIEKLRRDVEEKKRKEKLRKDVESTATPGKPKADEGAEPTSLFAKKSPDDSTPESEPTLSDATREELSKYLGFTPIKEVIDFFEFVVANGHIKEDELQKEFEEKKEKNQNTKYIIALSELLQTELGELRDDPEYRRYNDKLIDFEVGIAKDSPLMKIVREHGHKYFESKHLTPQQKEVHANTDRIVDAINRFRPWGGYIDTHATLIEYEKHKAKILATIGPLQNWIDENGKWKVKDNPENRGILKEIIVMRDNAPFKNSDQLLTAWLRDSADAKKFVRDNAAEIAEELKDKDGEPGKSEVAPKTPWWITSPKEPKNIEWTQKTIAATAIDRQKLVTFIADAEFQGIIKKDIEGNPPTSEFTADKIIKNFAEGSADRSETIAILNEIWSKVHNKLIETKDSTYTKAYGDKNPQTFLQDLFQDKGVPGFDTARTILKDTIVTVEPILTEHIKTQVLDDLTRGRTTPLLQNIIMARAGEWLSKMTEKKLPLPEGITTQEELIAMLIGKPLLIEHLQKKSPDYLTGLVMQHNENEQEKKKAAFVEELFLGSPNEATKLMGAAKENYKKNAEASLERELTQHYGFDVSAAAQGYIDSRTEDEHENEVNLFESKQIAAENWFVDGKLVADQKTMTDYLPSILSFTGEESMQFQNKEAFLNALYNKSDEKHETAISALQYLQSKIEQRQRLQTGSVSSVAEAEKIMTGVAPSDYIRQGYEGMKDLLMYGDGMQKAAVIGLVSYVGWKALFGKNDMIKKATQIGLLSVAVHEVAKGAFGVDLLEKAGLSKHSDILNGQSIKAWNDELEKYGERQKKKGPTRDGLEQFALTGSDIVRTPVLFGLSNTPINVLLDWHERFNNASSQDKDDILSNPPREIKQYAYATNINNTPMEMGKMAMGLLMLSFKQSMTTYQEVDPQLKGMSIDDNTGRQLVRAKYTGAIEVGAPDKVKQFGERFKQMPFRNDREFTFGEFTEYELGADTIEYSIDAPDTWAGRTVKSVKEVSQAGVEVGKEGWNRLEEWCKGWPQEKLTEVYNMLRDKTYPYLTGLGSEYIELTAENIGEHKDKIIKWYEENPDTVASIKYYGTLPFTAPFRIVGWAGGHVLTGFEKLPDWIRWAEEYLKSPELTEWMTGIKNPDKEIMVSTDTELIKALDDMGMKQKIMTAYGLVTDKDYQLLMATMMKDATTSDSVFETAINEARGKKVDADHYSAKDRTKIYAEDKPITHKEIADLFFNNSYGLAWTLQGIADGVIKVERAGIEAADITQRVLIGLPGSIASPVYDKVKIASRNFATFLQEDTKVRYVNIHHHIEGQSNIMEAIVKQRESKGKLDGEMIWTTFYVEEIYKIVSNDLYAKLDLYLSSLPRDKYDDSKRSQLQQRFAEIEAAFEAEYLNDPSMLDKLVSIKKNTRGTANPPDPPTKFVLKLPMGDARSLNHVGQKIEDIIINRVIGYDEPFWEPFLKALK